MSSLIDRYKKINDRILTSCEQAKRDPSSVKLLAVSKTKPPEMVDEFASLGQKFFGENKIQEAQAKIPLCISGLQWHLIGHLQSNKAKIAATLFDMVHSVDSLKIMNALDRNAESTLPILLQVNVAGDSAKFGFRPEEAEEIINLSCKLNNCEVHGLMTIPPFSEDLDKTRQHFNHLRELRDALEVKTGVPLPELSMGMSYDLEAAIEAGSTWIRVGSDLFGERK
tara:strand:+ start:1198 stop:1872 length:675 start_codon:yes stop_codon:yes gene_type:complete